MYVCTYVCINLSIGLPWSSRQTPARRNGQQHLPGNIDYYAGHTHTHTRTLIRLIPQRLGRHHIISYHINGPDAIPDAGLACPNRCIPFVVLPL